MKNSEDQTQRPSGKAARDQRQERLKQALRENLKRRKSKASGRDEFTDSSSNSDEVARKEPSEKRPGK